MSGERDEIGQFGKGQADKNPEDIREPQKVLKWGQQRQVGALERCLGLPSG